MNRRILFSDKAVKGYDGMGSVVCNACIFFITAILVLRVFRKDGKWSAANARNAFRFFTVQSNAFCALSALCMLLYPASRWAFLFKYTGTAAVTVTMLTVFLFLGPSIGSLTPLLKGNDLFMHLITPLLAIFSFVLFEKRGLGFAAALLGMLPIVLYGCWYLYKILYAPAEKRWEDFYGYNKGGKWPAAFAGMMAGGFAVCMMLMGLQNC